MPSSLRPTSSPIAWFGKDRLLLDDLTPYGLRRRVVARKGDWPDVQAFLAVAVKEAEGAEVHCWMYEQIENGFAYLWICWKVNEEAR